MGIYLPNIEMPKSCGFCPLRYEARDGDECYLGASLTEYQKRPDDCPLVPVPPHGRLIDADARVDVQIYNDEFEDFQTVNMSIDDLLDSSWIELEDDPTIIQAEEGE